MLANEQPMIAHMILADANFIDISMEYTPNDFSILRVSKFASVRHGQPIAYTLGPRTFCFEVSELKAFGRHCRPESVS